MHLIYILTQLTLNKIVSNSIITFIILTFHLVAFAWIFFRANTLSDAHYIVMHLFKGIEFKMTGYGLGLGGFELYVAILAILFMEIIQYFQERIRIRIWLVQKTLLFRWSCYYLITIVILLFGQFESKSDFIYFQF